VFVLKDAAGRSPSHRMGSARKVGA
jgi:hypothetical protein